MRGIGVFLFSAVLLSACKTVPIYTTEKAAFAPPRSDQGVIRITKFQVPKDEPVATFLLVLGAIGGAKINHPVSSSVFDVTNQVTYLGTMNWYESSFGTDWLETSVPAGKRRLMLTLTGSSSVVSSMPPVHVDFIDVDVKANGISYIALSRQGFARFPYLYEISISDLHANACSSLSGVPREHLKSVDQYMTSQQISSNMRDFRWFCMQLSENRRIQRPTEEARTQFEKHRGELERLHHETYGKWKAEAEERKPYDLMRSYEPPAPQPTL